MNAVTIRTHAKMKQNFVKTQLAATRVIVSLDIKTQPLETAQVCLVIFT